MKRARSDFENARPTEWRKYIDKRKTFFRTSLGGRIVKVRVHFKPVEDGYITWYLAVRRCETEKIKKKKWTTPWLRLEDWEKLGVLSLALSRFCAETRYMSKENFAKIQTFKRNWNRLVEKDFEDLKTMRRFVRELVCVEEAQNGQKYIQGAKKGYTGN